MPGDKISRVKSIRHWLEKAEKSYGCHKNISGELNLIMAKAEMKRLDETHSMRRIRVWAARICALAASLVIAGGYFYYNEITKTPQAASGTQVTEKVKTDKEKIPDTGNESAGSQQDTVSNNGVNSGVSETQQQDSKENSAASADNPVILEQNENVNKADSSSETVNQPQTEAPAEKPVMTDTEIQSVVGEAGRALRGK